MSEIDRTGIENALSEAMEKLASIEHDRWAHWQRYLHGKGTKQADGSLNLPAHLVTQWERQCNTSYDDLSDLEKESDRAQVRKYLPVVVDAVWKAQAWSPM